MAELQDLVAPPPRPRFREQVYERAEAAERRAARRWRLAAAVCACAMPIAAASAAGVVVLARTSPPVAGIVDQTVTCPLPIQGGVPVFDLRAEPLSKMLFRGKLVPRAAQLFVEIYPPGVGTAVDLVGLTSFSKGWAPADASCTKAAPIPLARGTLPREGVYLRNEAGAGSSLLGLHCLAGSTITIRLRARLVKPSTPVAAQLAIRSGTKQRPMAYVDWTPDKISVYATDDCN